VNTNEVQLHIPDEGISALSNDLLNSFEQSNREYTSNDHQPGVSNVVAQHYNKLEEKGREQRVDSRIFHMRNLNNWIKSRLIGNTLDLIRKEKGWSHPIKVLDLGCGKGGDLLKWERGNIDHVVCADIAETSVNQCEDRYGKLKLRGSKRVFSAEFITADCSKTSVREKMRDKDLELDLVSCQFAFHYSFESLPQAEQMFANVSSNLREGGYFIGTTTDANDIMRRLNLDETPDNRKFGNSVFSVAFPEETDLNPPPLFGAKYNFHLEEVVDCPEFLVHFATFQKLALRYGLHLVRRIRFEDFIKEELRDGKELMSRMKALETYPAYANRELVSEDKCDYTHAEEHIKSSSSSDDSYRVRIGTLSKSEWEAVSLYLVFIFQKRDGRGRKRSLSPS